MGYLFLSLSLLSGTTKGFCGKKVSMYTKGYSDAAIINIVRMFICIVIGAVIAVCQSVSIDMFFEPTLILIAMLSGISTAVFILCWMISVRSGSYAMLDVFLMLGVGVTIALGRVVLHEKVTVAKLMGFVLLVVAAYVMCSYNTSLNGKMSVKALGLLVACGAANGIADFSHKLFTAALPAGNAAVYNLYSYVFSAIALFAGYFIIRRFDGETVMESRELVRKTSGYVVVMAICLFLNSYFKTLAAAYLDSAVLYPLSQGTALILSVFMAGAFFKEKVTAKCAAGAALAFAALLTINFL